MAGAPSLPPALHRHLRPLARAVLPEAAAFSEADWDAMAAIIAEALAAKPAAMRRQLGLFVTIVALLVRLRLGRPLGRADDAAVRRLLESLERAPLLPIRRGTWGLRTLVFMGWYTRPEAARAIGYGASAAGWEAVR